MEEEIRASQDGRVYWRSDHRELLKKAVSGNNGPSSTKRTSLAAGLPSPTRTLVACGVSLPYRSSDGSLTSNSSVSSDNSTNSASSSGSRIAKRRRSAMIESLTANTHDNRQALERIRELSTLLSKQNNTALAVQSSPCSNKTKTVFSRTKSLPVAVLPVQAARSASHPSLFTNHASKMYHKKGNSLSIPPAHLDIPESSRQSTIPAVESIVARKIVIPETGLERQTQELQISERQIDAEDDALQQDEDSFDLAIGTLDDDGLQEFFFQASQQASEIVRSSQPTKTQANKPLADAVPKAKSCDAPDAKSVPPIKPVISSQDRLKKPFKAPTRINPAKIIPQPVRQPASVVLHNQQRQEASQTIQVGKKIELHPEILAALAEGFELADDGDMSF